MGGFALRKPTQSQIAKLKEAVEFFSPVIKRSLQNKSNEADTRIIINDLLEKVFGYDKYFEVTAEHMVKSTYVDYAIVIDGKAEILIEVKSMDSNLKQDHIRQTVNYAASEGVKWAILTNGCEWQLYRVIVDKQVDKELFLKFSLLDPEIIDYTDLYVLTKESLRKGLIDEYWDYKNALKPSVVLNVLLSQPVIDKLRREVSAASGYKVTSEEIVDILVSKVIRPEVIRKSSTAQRKIPKKVVAKPSQGIDIDRLTPMQCEILKILKEANTPVSLDRIKELLIEKGLGFKSLAGTFRGLSIRLGGEISCEDGSYSISDYLKNLLEEKTGVIE